MEERSEDLARIALQIRRGDVDAFEALVRMLHAPLCEVVNAYIRAPDIAEEIVQDVFLALWTRRSTLDIRALRPYVFASARNGALAHLQHRRVENRVEVEQYSDEPPGMGSRTRTPEQLHQQAEIRIAIRAALDSLPARARLALTLRWDHDMSYAEVAESMGISVKAVEKLLNKGMRRLRHLLSEAL